MYIVPADIANVNTVFDLDTKYATSNNIKSIAIHHITTDKILLNIYPPKHIIYLF